jgi:hypothetical protein
MCRRVDCCLYLQYAALQIIMFTVYKPTKCTFPLSLFYLQIHPYICFGPLKDHHQGVQNNVQSTPIRIHSVVTTSSTCMQASITF